jgi:hypothetical protein
MIQWAGHVTWIGKSCNEYKILVVKSLGEQYVLGMLKITLSCILGRYIVSEEDGDSSIG